MTGPGEAIDNAASLFGIELQPEWREAAIVHFVALQAAAGLFVEFPLEDEAEFAPVFTA